LLHAADVAVLPSHGVVETLPLAVIEAMAVGIPVVASEVGSMAELIRDGESGFLIPAADAVALAERLAHIFQDPAGARDMGTRGREVVRGRFSIERTVRSYETLFEELVAG
jgi:glycosyltransferase involved in cell wall biosynthesis